MRHRMLSIGLFPAICLMAGAVLTLAFDLSPHWGLWMLFAASAGALPAWWWRVRPATVTLLALGFVVAGALLTADARERALHSSLRAALDAEFGHFLIESLGPEGAQPPIPVRAVLLEDATVRETYVSLRTRVVAMRLRDRWLPVEGGVTVSVGGDSALRSSAVEHDARVAEWRAGRS